jgi:hypothetical protein
MKKLSLLLLITFLFSCGKDKNDPDNSPLATVEYKVDGQSVKFTEEDNTAV